MEDSAQKDNIYHEKSVQVWLCGRRGQLAKAQVSGIGTMRRSMAKLMSEKLIYRYNDEYKFFNPFFAQWLGRRRRG